MLESFLISILGTAALGAVVIIAGVVLLAVGVGLVIAKAVRR